MFGRGSPKINLMEFASKESKSSPKRGGKRKRRSPKAKSSRANWNPGLEKGLVQILLEHDSDCYRGQNGWTTDTWNFMSHPKASKFQRQGFPLYDDLYKLYAGKTAEGKHAFISLKRKEDDDDVRILQPSVEKVKSDGGVGSLAFLSNYNQYDEDDDNDVRIVHASTSSWEKGPAAESSSRDKRPVDDKEEESAISGAKGGKAGEKRKLNGDVAEMMGKYLELKTKQTQEEVAEQERARAKAEAADFSIKNCNTLLATIEELSGEERADAYDVFKDPQNREIFMTAEPSSRLIWLRRKIRLIISST